MRKFTHLFALLLTFVFCAGAASADVKIDAEHFPDAKFRQWVKEEVAKGGNVLKDEQAAAVTELNLSFYGLYDVSSLKGIEYFTALTSLCCDNNPIGTLDLSRNTALEWLRCSGVGLTELDLSGNPALKNLDCSSNRLTKLDLFDNPALESLNCSENQLAKLDLSDTPALSNLDCSGNKLTELDLSGTGALTFLNCGGNELTELELFNLPSLVGLDCPGNKLTELDLSGNGALESLSCSANKLTKLDLSGNGALNSIDCSKNKLTELDLSAHTALERLYCGGNALTKLDLSHNPALACLYCENPIRTLNLLKNPNLAEAMLPKDASVTLPNGDRIDAGDFQVKKTKDGKWRLTLSKYAGKLNVTARNKGVVEDTEVPMEVSDGVYTFEPCDGAISVYYKLSGEDSWLELILSAPGDGDPSVEGGEVHKEERPESGGDGDEDADEEFTEETRTLSVKLVNNTDAQISVALAGWPEDGGETGAFTKGWFNVAPGKERTVNYPNVSSSFGCGFYATSKGGKRVWGGKPGDARYAGSFWVHMKNAFASHDGTPIEGGKQVPFKRLSVSKDGKATIKFSVKK
jgi:Leucine-rich repeat (LRR) protein